MSHGFIGSKRTVYDVYPLHSKKVFLLVDPQNILGGTSDFCSTLATIAYLLQRNASVLVAASFGPLSGITLHLSKRERECALDAFKREGGMGYTNFFSSLEPSKKVQILRSIPDLDADAADAPAIALALKNVPNTGKTNLFAGLTNAQKLKALRPFVGNEFRPSSTLLFVDALQARFPNVDVHFASDCLAPPPHYLKPGAITVLENLHFYKNEISPHQSERVAMADVLASNVDIFINDSFGTACGVYASTVELPRLLQHGAAGASMDRELAFYSKFLSHPGHPLAVVIAGTNISEKLQLIRRLVGRVDRIIVGGVIAYPFLAAKGLSCGLGYSLEHEPTISVRTHCGDGVHTYIPCSLYAREILDLCALHQVELILPIDHVVTPNPNADKDKAVLVESSAVPPGLYSMDCGVNTINLFMRSLQNCHTVFWTGTLGWISKGFGSGTAAFATELGKSDLISIAGGRYTAQAVQEMNVAKKLLHVSSGGISCLEILQGSSLPAIEALSDVGASVPAAITAKSIASVNELLRKLPLFRGCNSHQLKLASKKFMRRVHGQGDLLVYNGDRHVCMHVVAQGGLMARYVNEYITAPERFIGTGQTVGMYEFITQASAFETVRVAQPDTVTFQISSSALNELLNAYPDLAAQLFQNLSEPLRFISNTEYHKHQSVEYIVPRNACRTRVPLPMLIPACSSLGKDILQDFILTICLQRLTMRFTPLVDTSHYVLQNYPAPPTFGFLWKLLERVQCHNGLFFALTNSVLRNIVYHQVVGVVQKPWLASLLGAVATAPLRILSYGIYYRDMNFKLVLDEALISGVVGVAPMTAYGATLALQRHIEHFQKKQLNRPMQTILVTLVKLLLGFIVFPVVFQRNFIYTQPSASCFWNHNAFVAYEAKQAASVLLRYCIHGVLKLMTTA